MQEIKPICDFYCKPANEEEAREIVKRAVAHGAKCHDSLEKGGKETFDWNDHEYWGALCGLTKCAGSYVYESCNTEHLTIEQLRGCAPLVEDLNTSEATTATAFNEWPDEPMTNFGVTFTFSLFLCGAEPAIIGMMENDESPVTKERWEACRRALYFAGMLRAYGEPEDNSDGLNTQPEELSEEAKIALDSFDPAPGGIPVQSSRGAGLKFDGGKPQMRLLPPVAMLEMAKVMTFGAEKYEADSWRQVEGANERYLDALGRHYNAWCRGEEVDDESGLSHMAHIMCNAAFLLELDLDSE